MNKTRILLADDHSLMRMGLAFLINSQKDMSVVGEAANGEEAVAFVRANRPDIVIMDLMMPKMSGAEATRRILAEFPKTKILILSSYGTAAELADAVNRGAHGVLLKDTATAELVQTIREIMRGQTAIPKSIMDFAREEAETPRLTERQQEILSSATRGLSNQEIALQFGITVIAVKKHMSAILSKVGAATRAEAVGIALRKHLLKV